MKKLLLIFALILIGSAPIIAQQDVKKKKAYTLTDVHEPTPPWVTPAKSETNLKLGQVNDSRFKAKRIERLRLGIDMSETLTVGQKGKVLFHKCHFDTN